MAMLYVSGTLFAIVAFLIGIVIRRAKKSGRKDTELKLHKAIENENKRVRKARDKLNYDDDYVGRVRGRFRRK